MELVAKAEEYMPLDRLEAARIYAEKAGIYGLRGQVAPARESSEKALQIIEEEYSLSDAAQKLAGEAFYIGPRRGMEKGLANGLLSITFFEEIGDLRQQMSTYHDVRCRP